MTFQSFQVKKWGWKGMAARMLLVPLLAGATASASLGQSLPPSSSAVPTSNTSNSDKARQLVAQAQTALKKGDTAKAEELAKQAQELRAGLAYTEARPETILAEVAKQKLGNNVASTRPVVNGEPKDLLKLGRQALAAGKIDQAQDYAAQANQAAVSKSYRWGLFEDTPASLSKDVQDARKKTDRVQAEELFKKAKTLYTKQAASDTERLQNLDQALNMAYQAKNLHGDYSFWDFGDKPDSLIAQIEASKVSLRKKMGPNALATSTPKATEPSQPGSGFASGVRQAAASKRDEIKSALTTANLDIPQVSAAKTEVMSLVSEGRQLLQEGKLVEARTKAEQARLVAEKAGLSVASFATDKDSPAKLSQTVQSTGKEMIDSLLRDADKQLAAKDPAKAEAAMNMAREMSNSLGLYTKGIDEKMAKAGIKVTMPLGLAAMPAEPMLPTALPAAADKLMPVAPDMKLPSNVTVGGSQLLDQAAKELARGDMDMARKIAIQAYNSDPAVKSDAQALLRQIDVESTAGNKKMAQQAYVNAVASFQSQQYETALEVFAKIDPVLLTEEQRTQAKSFMEQCIAKTSPSATAATSPMTSPMMPMTVRQASASETTPGTARVGELKPMTVETAPTPPALVPSATPGRLTTEKPLPSLADEQAAMKDVSFQKLRQESLDALKNAGEAWSRGETDAAMRILEDYTAKVKASNQTLSRQSNLLRSIDTRMEAYTVMKHSADVLKKEASDKQAFKRERLNANLAEQMKEEEIKKKVSEINDLMKNKKFVEAERLAAQTKLLDPDNPTLTFIAEQTKYAKRNEDYKQLQDEKERFFLKSMNDAERMGPSLTNENPISIDPNAARRAAARGEDLYQRRMTEQERRIENTLQGSVSMKIEKKTLRDAISELRSKSGVNIVVDDVALDDEKISLDSVNVDEDLKDIPMKDALEILLSKARCAHVIENNVVKVTTQKRSKGRLITKVFHVMDLVTPIPEYGLSPHQTFAGAMAGQNKLPDLNRGNGATPFIPNSGLRDGTLVSGGGTQGMVGNNTGVLQNMNEQKGSIAMTPQRSAYSQQLMKLITGLVRPYSWSELGGNGNLSYYDIGGALVVNQTGDVIGEVQQLLDALRRLQDLSVSVEIRVVSLSEAFFERVGVDFSMNIKTNNTTLERQFATSQFRPQPFLNDINSKGIVGFSPATSFTSDLDVPIRPSSFGLSLPPFGGYQPSLGPTTNGGLSLGLAFLNDIQVYMFLEAAQGNRRVNIMQAPKITLFNGQTSTVFVGDFAFFTTGLQVLNVGGQFVYLPQNTAVPIGTGFNPQGGGGQQSGVSVTVQAVISADRRFVRLNLTPSLTALASANVPLFPITTFVTPVFEGGSQGQPIPFTQFYQQPSFTEIAAQTTVAVPDGGTVLLGGLKTMAQGRNEFGPPVLANVPYLNRLFKNIGIGTETRHVMLMVTPRIIINSEEELRQVSEGGLTGNN